MMSPRAVERHGFGGGAAPEPTPITTTQRRGAGCAILGSRRRHPADTTLESTNGAESPHLARKPNYDFEKRRKELDRKAKKDAKREERLQRKKENAENGVEGVDPDLEGIVLGPQPTADEAGEDTPQ